MKCFLHIGTEKTATTTLQNFLNLNRENLLSQGYLYTKSAGPINNRLVPLLAYNCNSRDDLTKTLGIITSDDLKLHQDNVFNQLSKELNAYFKPSGSGINTVVFSSEHIQSRLRKIEDIQRLKEVLNQLGLTDISVVVYLRNPPEIANSLYSTAIKGGSVDCLPPPPTDFYYRNVCHHQNTLEKYSAVFGDSAVIPRIFHQDEFKNGSIISDFTDVIGIADHRDYIIPDNKNESLSITGIELLRRINKSVPKFIENKPNSVRANLTHYFEKHFSDGKYVMPRDLYERYDEAFKESNEWVRNKYFPNKQTLFPYKEYPCETKCNLSDEQLESLANFISDIWKDKHNQTPSLTKT